MNIFDSFVTWLENLFKPLIKLYHEDSTTFFVGAIFAVLILLIIVIFLARRAEDDDRPSKKIKYDDIDWSTEGDNAKPETAAKAESAAKAEAAVKAEPAAPATPVIEAPKQSYGVGEVDVNKNTFGHEGLSPEVTEALMRSVKAKKEEDFAVPMWMTKQTLSLDDIELSDAQEWVEEQLKEKELQAHDRQVEKATVERIAEILEKIDLCDKAKEDYKRRKAEGAVTEAPAETEKIDLDEIAPLASETEPVAEPEPAPEVKAEAEVISEPVQAEAETFETGTLAKILKEVEDLKAESDPEETYDAGEDKEPDWGIAATLARLEAMQVENDSLLKEIEEDSGYGEELLKNQPKAAIPEDLPSLEQPDFPEVERELYDSDTVFSDRPAVEALMPEKRTVRRFGLKNRDTNRSGRKFTEEELMEQIRD